MVSLHGFLGIIFVGLLLWLPIQFMIFLWVEKAELLRSGSMTQDEAAEAKRLLTGWRRFFLRTGLARAVLETLLVQTLSLIGSLWLEFSFVQVREERLDSSTLILTGPCCILWCALRLRLPTGSWLRKSLFDGAVGALLGLVMAPLVLIAAFTVKLEATASFQALLEEGLVHYPTLLLILLVAFCGVLGTFLIVRGGVRLWLRWNRLRRTRLRWALTHAHLLVVVLGAGLLGALMLGVNVFTSTGFPFYILSIAFGLTIFTGIALAIVLPPSALFSYLFARRLTRRIEMLAVATSALRKGDYAIRVPVEGEDEIARLQADFNTMAANLERAMRDLQAERDAVATLLRARRELVASVSHELRTPVATLRGYLESTRIHWDEAPPSTLRHDLQVMEQEAIRLQTLIDDLFTLARAEVGKLELRCQAIDGGLIARRVAETMAPLAWQSGRVEVVAAVSGEPLLVLADPCRLEQALQNLVHNGVRHTPPGGIVVVSAQAGPGAIILQVKDTGEGIAPADLPHIWERFYRAESTRAHPNSGSGLGLALVKEMTEAMGGSVAVESIYGEGSCFTLRLPKAAKAESQAHLNQQDAQLVGAGQTPDE